MAERKKRVGVDEVLEGSSGLEKAVNMPGVTLKRLERIGREGTETNP